MNKKIIVEKDSIDENRSIVDIYNEDIDIAVSTKHGTKLVSLLFDNNVLEKLAELSLNHLIKEEIHASYRSNTENKKNGRRLTIYPAGEEDYKDL